MLTTLILLLIFVPPSRTLFFGSSGSCPCSCPAPPVCAPAPICAPQTQCTPQYNPTPSTFYQPGWIPAIPSYPVASSQPAIYSTSYSSAPAPLILPSNPSYVAPVSPKISPPFLTAPIPAPQIMVPPSPSYIPSFTLTPSNMGFLPSSYEQRFEVVPPFLQSGYAPASANYEKQYQEDSSLEVPPPPPPPPPPPIVIETSSKGEYSPSAYDYRTTETVESKTLYKPGLVPPVSTSYMTEVDEDGLVDKPDYWRKNSGETIYDDLQNEHNILKRMKTDPESDVPKTNNTCNSIKLANIMMRVITEDVTVSKRMIQQSTKLSFNGAKFDVFCATGEFSYSIHSRKYCEVTKGEVTCFAFR